VEEVNGRDGIAQEEGGGGISKYEGRQGRGQGFDGSREDDFEGLDIIVNAAIRSPGLETESQYTQEIAIFSGTHN